MNPQTVVERVFYVYEQRVKETAFNCYSVLCAHKLSTTAVTESNKMTSLKYSYSLSISTAIM
jgi:hypothetical protein